MNRIKKAGLILVVSSVAFVPSRVNVVTYNQLKNEAALKNNDTLYVVNFWATWCDPCVKELPLFQAAYTKYAAKKVKMVYVSLNSAKDIALVEKFVETKDLKPEVLLMGPNQNPNVWVNDVDSSWSGAIPATVMYRHAKKLYFHEGDFIGDNLDKLIQSKLK